MVTPGLPPADHKDEGGDGMELDDKTATAYRAMTARANLLSQDRFDSRFAAKELSRRMSKPRRKDWRRSRRRRKRRRISTAFAGIWPLFIDFLLDS